jgi:hypothetical protein
MMTIIMITETNNSQKKSVVWTCALMVLSRKIVYSKSWRHLLVQIGIIGTKIFIKAVVCTVYCVLCAVRCALCTVCCALCAVYCVLPQSALNLSGRTWPLTFVSLWRVRTTWHDKLCIQRDLCLYAEIHIHNFSKRCSEKKLQNNRTAKKFRSVQVTYL